MQLHDAVVPYHNKDWATIYACCRSLSEVLGIERVFVVTDKQHPYVPPSGVELFSDLPYVTIIDEKTIDCLITPNDIFKSYNLSKYWTRFGWVYQQLLKLGADLYLPDLSEQFLVCDSDLMFIKDIYAPIHQNEMSYTKASNNEFHLPYRNHYKRVFDRDPQATFSFVNHHAVFDTTILHDMRRAIEKVSGGISWDYACVQAIDKLEQSGMSEYEMYGNYLLEERRLTDMRRLPFRIAELNYIPTAGDFMACKRLNYDAIVAHRWARV